MILTALIVACRDVNSDAVHGTIELTETDVAPLAGGRVERVLVEEGQQVEAGDTLVVLTQSTIDAEFMTRRARLSAAEAELRDLRAGAREVELERARAELRAAEVEAERLARDAQRMAALLTSGGVSQSQADAAAAAARVSAERVRALRESRQLLEDGARPERIRSAEAVVRQARAQVDAIEATASELVLLSPHDGVVLGRHVEPGEVLAAGVPAVSLGDLKHPWVRVFVSPAMLAGITHGDSAAVSVDGAPGRSFRGRVVSISPTAEFTPRVALTEQERADLLFAVRLVVDDADPVLKAGLPVTVRFAPASR
ncbi:MAG: HlyD family secretion protein [Gemmatimonadota bacterium]